VDISPARDVHLVRPQHHSSKYKMGQMLDALEIQDKSQIRRPMTSSKDGRRLMSHWACHFVFARNIFPIPRHMAL
jgi:hypothetical protein